MAFVPTEVDDRTVGMFPWLRECDGQSITELEIQHGIFHKPDGVRRSLMFFRNSEMTSAIPETQRSEVFLEADDARRQMLTSLKDRIRASQCYLYDGYPATWSPTGATDGQIRGLDDFGRAVCEHLWDRILDSIEETDDDDAAAIDPLAEESNYHARFAESRLRIFVGREKVQQELHRFAQSDATCPCLITGPSGVGKSSLLAKLIHDYREQHPGDVLLSHFVGASPSSTNLREMLKRFCGLLTSMTGQDAEIPEDIPELIQTFKQFLHGVPESTRVLIVVDALDQLDETFNAHVLHWLPSQLPSHVKMIVSCVELAEGQHQLLDLFLSRPQYRIEVEPLSLDERKEIILAVPSLSAKSLGDRQIELLLSNPATENPLYLLIALEELRAFGDYRGIDKRIEEFPREGDAVLGIFNQVIDRLAAEFGEDLVQTVFECIASARMGVTENELHEIAQSKGCINEGLFPVLRQLRSYLLSRDGLLDFYHQTLLRTVRERFLGSEAELRQAHGRLAAYFDSLDCWLESAEEQAGKALCQPLQTRQANRRKADELVYHLLSTGQIDRASTVLLDPDFLESKVECRAVFDLAGELRAAVRHSGLRSDRREILTAIEAAVRHHLYFLKEYPTLLFQTLWNQCWWHDAPQAAAHYAPRQSASSGGLLKPVSRRREN